MKSNDQIKMCKDLHFLEDKYDVVVYGSFVEGGMRPNSDIDIAIISYEAEKDKNVEIQKELLGQFPLKYDIRIFELFPIYLQISIIKNHRVIFGDPLEISEYFYSFRKKWDDCKYRILTNQFSSYRERLSLIR
jgi:predicted nucleotidyltransferase